MTFYVFGHVLKITSVVVNYVLEEDVINQINE